MNRKKSLQRSLFPFGMGILTGLGMVVLFFVGTFFWARGVVEKNKSGKKGYTESLYIDVSVRAMDSLELIKLYSYTSKDTVSAIDSEKDYLFLNFWATWCGPCVKEFPDFETYISERAPSKIDFFFISGEEDEKISSFVDKKNYKLPFFRKVDIQGDLTKHNSIPTNYIIDRKDSLIYKVVGSANWSDDAYDNLLKSIID